MLLISRESKLNRKLEKRVIPVIEEIIHASFNNILEICASRIAEIFETPYACIHFTRELGLPWEDSLPALKFCPVATVKGEIQNELFSIECNLNEIVVREGIQIHNPGLGIKKWDSFMDYFKLKSGISIPLNFQQETYGVIDVYHKDKIDFGKIDLAPLVALGSCLYGAVKKEVMIKSLQERDDVIEAFARTIEAADRYTGGHVDRVRYYAMIIGNAYNLDPSELRSLKRAALLHDIGKIGVPEVIINKPGPLDDNERSIMERHPLIGKEIIGLVTDASLQAALDGILYHHERIDGRGYPHGLNGDSIPLIARIIAIADTYDALTSDRPYRKGMDKPKAMSILNECRGTQLDKTLVHLFLKELEKEENDKSSAF